MSRIQRQKIRDICPLDLQRIYGMMFTKLNKTANSMKTLTKDYLITGSAWGLIVVVSLVFWSTDDPEVQLDFTFESIALAVILFTIFLAGICSLKYCQYQNFVEKRTFYQRIAFLVCIVSFAALAGIFYYLLIGLLFVLLSTTFLDYMKPSQAWLLAVAVPILAGTYDVFFKQMSFYIEIKLLFIVLNSLVLVSSSKIKSEQQAREQASQLLRELQATQHLLESTVKRDERLRIARDLHDSMGHKLTALKLQLELASHLAPDLMLDKVNTAKKLSGTLLDDVRASVNEFRDSNGIDLNKAVKALVPNIASVRFELQLDLNQQLLSNRQAETLFRCIQESITNVLRHANANHCLIELDDNGCSAFLRVQDNGDTKNSSNNLGNGLAGMAERVKEVDGEIMCGFNQSGFEVKLSLPLDHIH